MKLLHLLVIVVFTAMVLSTSLADAQAAYVSMTDRCNKVLGFP